MPKCSTDNSRDQCCEGGLALLSLDALGVGVEGWVWFVLGSGVLSSLSVWNRVCSEEELFERELLRGSRQTDLWAAPSSKGTEGELFERVPLRGTRQTDFGT